MHSVIDSNLEEILVWDLFKWVSRLSMCNICSHMKGSSMVVQQFLALVICYVHAGAKWALIPITIKRLSTKILNY